MVTKTLTAVVDTVNAFTDVGQYAKIVRIVVRSNSLFHRRVLTFKPQLQRNLEFLKFRDPANVIVPVRDESNSSPMKQSASNRQPGQTSTRTIVDTAINHELAKARYLMDDLADHVFGHIVSTELSRDILCQFIDEKIVTVIEGKDALDPDSEGARHAVEQAFEDADMHDCIRLDTERDSGEPGSSSTGTKGKGKQKSSKGRGKRKQKAYSFKWNDFPAEPIDEDKLVDFLNEVTDRAFGFARSKLANVTPRLRNRLATRTDKNHAMPLLYELDGEDMRPDFLLLPIQAFSNDFKSVDPRYLNFTASRLVGEAKNKDLAKGVDQVQRYARGLKRAQPWVHYVLAMSITKDKAVFMRGEGSGTERLELILSDGRGCIEFIRILLGLALAEDVDLGQNPDVELKSETRTCRVNNVNQPSVTSNTPSSGTVAQATRTTNTESIAVSSSCGAISKAALDAFPISTRTRSGSAASKALATSSNSRGASNVLPYSSCIRNVSSACPQPPVAVSSTSSKRVYSEIDDDSLQERRKKKKCKVTEPVVKQEERVVFFPLRVYQHTCLGILFTSSSIRGRGTAVFCVLDISDETIRLALKMSWQDLERVPGQVAVMKILKDNLHPNVIVPLEYIVSSYMHTGDSELTHFQDIRRGQAGPGMHDPRRHQRFSRRADVSCPN